MSEGIVRTASKSAYRPNIIIYHEDLEVHDDKTQLSDNGINCILNILGTLGI